MLTYIQINTAKPTAKEYALSDSQGLYLTIRPNGSKLWRFKYRFLDKQKTLHLGLNSRQCEKRERQPAVSCQFSPLMS